MASAGEMNFSGPQTKLGAALDGARDELAGLPVAGVVMVTDGADTSDASLDPALLAMKAQKLPVFTVGVGSEQLPRDVQIDRVSTPRSVLKDASLLVDVVVRNTGFGGRTVTVDVEDEGRIIGSRRSSCLPTVLPRRCACGRSHRSPVRASSSSRCRRRTASWSRRTTCASRWSTCATCASRFSISKGEPRFEMKFLRRGVIDDKNLEVVALQRTADNKYMRLFGDEPEDPEELVGGFPKTREELFKYRGLILGSVEAGVFAGDQLQMIAEFVERRGGGLLMLGGARSFGEGGYGGTPVADALPLLIDPRTRASEPAGLSRLKIMPTRAGQAHAVTQMAESEAASMTRWNELPQVTAVNAPLPRSRAPPCCSTAPTSAAGRSPCCRRSDTVVGRSIALTAAGHLAVADARLDSARGSDPRDTVATAAALAGGRSARRRRCARRRAIASNPAMPSPSKPPWWTSGSWS